MGSPFPVPNTSASPIQSVQRGTITITGTTVSGTATITAVNTGKSGLNWTGVAGAINNASELLVGVDLTNSTTVTATRGLGTNGVTINAYFEVLEFK